MDAREFLDSRREETDIIQLTRYDGETPIGRGKAIVVEHEFEIAVMLEDCGLFDRTGIKAGSLVRFKKHPEAESIIIGSPANIGDH